MKSYGRIFEVNSQLRPINKYVIVYENQDWFVCKEFGTSYPKTINKSYVMTWDEYKDPFKRKGNRWYVLDRNHECEFKVLYSELRLTRKSTELKNIESRINNYLNGIERCQAEIERNKNYLVALKKEHEKVSKEYEEILADYKLSNEEFEKFGEKGWKDTDTGI